MTQPHERNPSDPHEPDPELAALLASVDDELPAPVDMDSLYSEVRGQISAARQSPMERLRAKPTWMRRLLGLAGFFFVVGISVGTRQRDDLGAYPLGYLLAYAASITTLLVVCAFAALRPLHRPSLSRPAGLALGFAAVAATVVLAIAPGFHAHAMLPDGMSFFAHASPCFVYGFLVGVPIYGILRVLDRGNPLGRVLAASAAGLTGNLVLELQCATGGASHLVFGHAGVVALYVLGVLALEWALRPRR